MNFSGAKPPKLKSIKLRGGYTNRAPSLRVTAYRKPKLVVKSGYPTILPTPIQSGGNRVTQVPAMKLYLDMDPYDDHQGHGYWTSKFDPDKKQSDYEPSDQDVGRPNVNVSHHFDTAEEVEDETIKSFRVSPSERLIVSMRQREPQALRMLHRKRTIRSKAHNFSRFRRHPSIVIRTRRNMPKTKPRIFRRTRRIHAH